MTNYDILKEYEEHQTPVPSYDEWKAKLEENAQLKKLQKQIEIAIKCLRNYKSGTTDKWFAEVALEQIEELEK